MHKSRYYVVGLALACSLMLSASASMAARATKPVFWSAERLVPHKETIQRVQDYLSGLTTIAADFTQTAPDGSITTGKFLLERPGKMRWQYAPPSPILIVSNGKTLTFYDRELEQVSYISMDDTIIGFLAKDKISFEHPVGITNIENKANAIRITVAQRDKPNDGQLTLELSDKPLMLRNLIIRDATQQVTMVGLSNAEFGIKIDKNAFEFKDPRKPRR
ncbi:MAG: outer membrane lipoprotein carrier protein LolA [Rickettsiales bacterium]|nr:outer membrane lipoprotein carrier protein LolA [Rickettsiales bacterium]